MIVMFGIGGIKYTIYAKTLEPVNLTGDRMDALLLLILKNKEFGTLVIIACFTVAQYFQNRGQFSLHLEKINNIKATSDKAYEKSEKAIEAIADIKPKVEDMSKTIDWFKQIADDKWKDNNGNQKESTT